jgi:hypothetical protein
VVTARTKVRTVIDVAPGRDVGLSRGGISIVFESRDIGYTQGTTLRYGGNVLARYRGGATCWDSALERARHLLEEAMELTVADNGPFISRVFRGHLGDLLKADGCMPWDGEDIDRIGKGS